MAKRPERLARLEGSYNVNGLWHDSRVGNVSKVGMKLSGWRRPFSIDESKVY